MRASGRQPQRAPNGARAPSVRIMVAAYALALALLAWAASPLLAWLPESAVGGVLMLQGLQMVSPALWRVPGQLWGGRRSLPSIQWRVPAANWGVAAIVAANAIVLGPGHAVFIGASFAVLLFARANMRDVVQREWTVATRSSLKTRPGPAMDALRRHGERIVLLEMQGSLFFGTADALRERLQTLAGRAAAAILDLHQVRPAPGRRGGHHRRPHPVRDRRGLATPAAAAGVRRMAGGRPASVDA